MIDSAAGHNQSEDGQGTWEGKGKIGRGMNGKGMGQNSKAKESTALE